MRILMVSPLPKEVGGSYTTGVCKVAYELSRQQLDGIEIYMSSTNISQKKAECISTYQNQYNGYKWLILDVLNDIILHPFRTIKEFKYYKYKCHVNPLRFEFFKVNIRSHIKRLKPDVIHIHTTECVPTYFANTEHVPMICTMHGVFYRGLDSQKRLGDFLQACVDCSDYFTGLTTECEMLMKVYFSIPSEKLTIIPNGINTDVYYYDEIKRNIIRTELNANSSIVFTTVASLQERKGQLKFIKVLEKLDIDYQYWIIGVGEDEQKIKTYINKKNLGNRVKCLGRIDSDKLYMYYSAADIYAHPSTMEGQALCEMEAYSTGIRIIVNQDIKDTIVTDVNNEQIYYLLDMNSFNKESLEAWLKKGNKQRRSRRDMSWDLIAKQYGEVYKKVALNKK